MKSYLKENITCVLDESDQNFELDVVWKIIDIK